VRAETWQVKGTPCSWWGETWLDWSSRCGEATADCCKVGIMCLDVAAAASATGMEYREGVTSAAHVVVAVPVHGMMATLHNFLPHRNRDQCGSGSAWRQLP